MSYDDFFKKKKTYSKNSFKENYQSVKQFGSSSPTFGVQTVCKGSQQTTKVAISELMAEASEAFPHNTTGLSAACDCGIS